MTKLEQMISTLKAMADDLKPYADKAYEIDGELDSEFDTAINTVTQAANALKHARERMQFVKQQAANITEAFPEEQ